MGMETFGEALRRLRGDMSLRRVSDLSNCSKTHIADLENGRRQPTAPVATALDKALGANGELVSLADRGQRAVVWPAASMDALPPVEAILTDPRRYVDGTIVDELRAQLEASKADDGTLGSTVALPKVQAVLGAVQHAVREVKPEVRRQLLVVGAEGAEFVGWLYRDLRDLATATYWYDRAIEWAQEADDGPMQGYVLLRKSQLAYDRQDALKALTLADAAGYSSGRFPPGVRAEILQQQALGLAMVGEPVSDVERKLDEARELLPEVSAGDPNALGSSFTERVLLLRSSACFTEAGKPARAAEILQSIIAGGSLSYRDVGYFQARHAAALALIGEPDQAASVGLEAARVARATRSRRTVTVLGEMLQSMDRWRRRPQVRALQEFLADRPVA
ncbi:helix-turn-helix domain-containing protein [Nonomuraea sp. NN258]|uniref:helix-turn-helix domain-containing protein n=1 Tax=Nonomuraea antri TaxID=2730852 RepID=UPI001567CBFF|nr:helix-turn-helix domain-containing protein [Nonomuraea antri]NRQ31254.1 helix-turn-helix domain-containing protein [Nonomuraea antri]